MSRAGLEQVIGVDKTMIWNLKEEAIYREAEGVTTVAAKLPSLTGLAVEGH